MTIPIWRTDNPPAPGLYIAAAESDERKTEAFPAMWDGKTWQYWSGFFDYAITHWMPTDLETRK